MRLAGRDVVPVNRRWADQRRAARLIISVLLSETIIAGLPRRGDYI